MPNKRAIHQCCVCGRSGLEVHLEPIGALRRSIADELLKEHPDARSEQYICINDLNGYRNRHIERLLQDEKGELTTLERDVLDALATHELVSEHPTSGRADGRSVGEKLSDHMAEFGGSWRFILFFLALLVAWIVVNMHKTFGSSFDPYPYILLNLILSCVAALQAPIIMMSQNRQEAKDRLRSEYDYKINLKAELEIRHLHEKVDHLLKHQWERLVEIQQIQIEILNELLGKEQEAGSDVEKTPGASRETR